MDNSRSQRIRFKVMRDGSIRAHDAVKKSGISEWHLINPWCICDTITASSSLKILISDSRIYEVLLHSATR